MAKTSKEIGSWLLNNENLKGTPDFNFAVDQYKKAKERENNPFGGGGVFDEQVLGANNPEGTLLGRELKRGLLRSASTPFTVIAGSAASRLGEEATLSGEYGENNLLMESFKEHSGLSDEAIANLRKSRGTDLSTPEGAANELTKMGYGPTRTQNFLDIYKTKLANAKALSEDPNKREAVIESGVKNITKANELNAAAASIAQNSTAQSFSKMHEEHGDNSVKQLLSDAFENPAGFGMYMTEIMVQSSPQIIAGLATSALTKNPAAGVSVLGAGTFLQEYGPSVNEFLQNNGINKNLSKKEAVALLADRDLMRDAAKVGATRATMITLFEVLGMSAAGKGIMKNFAVNAAAGSGGEASAQLATQDLTGKPLNPREIVLEGLAEFGQAPFEAGIVGAGKVKNRIKSPYITNKDGTISLKSQKDLTPLEAKAYTSLANILKDLADAGGMDGVPFDLMDINPESKKGAKIVLDNAHLGLLEEMNKMFGILGQKGGPLNEKQVESLEELKVLIKAQVARLEGRNKTKGQVGRGNYDALEALVGNTQEGRNLINTLMMLDALTQLDSKGLQGKLSTFTDTFSVSGRLGGKNQNIGEQVKSSIKPILSLGVASQTYGASILGQLAITRVGKAIDKKRGTYSVLDKYIKDNIKGDPLDAPTGPSILAAKALKDQENKFLKEQEAYDEEIAKAKEAYEKRLLIEQQEADAKEAAKRNLPPHPDSPQGTLENATGLNRAQVASILRILKRLPRLSKRMKDGITDYQQSVGKGGRVGPKGDPVLNDVIRHVAGMAEELGITPPRSGNPNQGGPANTQLETPAIARGIEDNKKVLAELTNRAKTNSSVEPYRAPLEKALNSLGLNLGVDPESAANEIVETAKAEGVPNKAVKSYLKPYVDRIVRQQYSKKPNEFQGEQVDTTTPPVVDQSIPVFDQTTDNSTALNQYENLTKSSDVLPNAPAFQKPPGIVEDEVEFDTPENPVEPTKIREAKVPPIPRDGPALNQMPTALDILPDENEVAAMRDPKWKPEVKRSKEDAAQFLQDRWEKATGRTDPYEYTEENIPIIADIMVAEAMRNLESDGNAIGWYDAKIKAAKKIVSIIEPRIMQSDDAEAMFDFALAVTSNGQAVTGNFNLALEVFRTGMDTGKLPENFNKGGDRAEAMRSAFKFYNAFGRSGSNISIQQFLDQDFTVKELKDYIDRFNANNKTEIKVGGQERVDTKVKGSYILGPKIGQGFYQNIRGNYNPLTMDLWWMRTWNRMVGRPFESKKTDTVMAKTRDKIATEIKKGGKVENQLVRDTLKELGETKKGLYKDPQRMDVFIFALDKRWQKYFRDYQKANNKKNPPKPQLFKSTGTHVLNSSPQMQAQPSGPDRPYMRKVVEKAREKLREQGIDIETADFQALMWYPEKLLYKKLGVDPGNGADTDYQDAATLLAQKEGITDGQIEEALRDPSRDGEVSSRPDTRQQDGRLYPGASAAGPITAEGPGNPTRQSRGPALTSPEGNQPRTNPPSIRRLKPYVEPTKKVFEIGKPGGDLEDGIGTLGEALEMARGLNLTVTLLNEMPEGTTGEYAGMADVKGADGLIRSTTKGNVRVLKQGANHPMFNGAVRSVEEFTSLMHEIAHGLAIQRVDRVPSAEYREAKNPFVLAEQALESVKVGSFEDFILDAIENHGRENEVLQEIANLQENIDVEIARRPELGTTGVRPLRQVAEHIKANPALRSRIDDTKLQEINNQFRRTYLRTVSEMAVDPLWVYFINPKLIKKVAPQTARAIREVFNKMGGNNPVTFYSYPLATIMAIVMGVLANMEQEEEERLRQPPPPPGALSPQMGALSA
jgi:hypothetical protein